MGPRQLSPPALPTLDSLSELPKSDGGRLLLPLESMSGLASTDGGRLLLPPFSS